MNIYQRSVMMLLREKCYSCSKLMEKLNGLPWSPKGDKVVPQTRLAGLLHWVPAKGASGRIKVSPCRILWVINAGFACRQRVKESCRWEWTHWGTFTGELEHLLSVLHVIYQTGCRWLIVGVNTKHSVPKFLLMSSHYKFPFFASPWNSLAFYLFISLLTDFTKSTY